MVKEQQQQKTRKISKHFVIETGLVPHKNRAFNEKTCFLKMKRSKAPTWVEINLKRTKGRHQRFYDVFLWVINKLKVIFEYHRVPVDFEGISPQSEVEEVEAFLRCSEAVQYQLKQELTGRDGLLTYLLREPACMECCVRELKKFKCKHEAENRRLFGDLVDAIIQHRCRREDPDFRNWMICVATLSR